MPLRVRRDRTRRRASFDRAQNTIHVTGLFSHEKEHFAYAEFIGRGHLAQSRRSSLGCLSHPFLATICDLHPNLWRPQTWGLTHQLFVGKRTQVAESRMSPGPIIKGFDVIKGAAPSLRSCLK